MSENNSQASLMRICSNSQESALAIRDHSFAIVKVPPETTLALTRAKAAAHKFLQEVSVSSSSSSREKDYIEKYRVIANGNLFGYNIPSTAKVLFRAICSQWGNQQMAWPNQELQLASVDVATKLHTLLIECYDEIINLSTENDNDKTTGIGTTTTTSSTEGQAMKEVNDEMTMRKSVSTKRGRQTDNDDNNDDKNSYRHKHSRTDGSTNSTGDKLALRTSATQADRPPPRDHISVVCKSSSGKSPVVLSLSRTLREAKYCPLDYFLYHGNNGKAIINCSEHKDRGLLICVALSDVPGLEVLPKNSQEHFVCPEEETLLKPRQQQAESGAVAVTKTNNQQQNLVCVMAGDQLKQFVVSKDHEDDGDNNIWSACIHRVKDQLKGPRFSIMYELRASVV